MAVRGVAFLAKPAESTGVFAADGFWLPCPVQNQFAPGGATGFKSSLVVVQTALAIALLTCGGQMLQAYQTLWNTDLGIQPDRLLTFEMRLLRYKEFDARIAFVNAEWERVRAIPGVINAGAISQIPLTNSAGSRFYPLAGQSRSSSSQQIAMTRVVSQDYFATAAVAAPSMTWLLYRFKPDYLPTASASAVLLLSVATPACLVPARRASRIDPMVALRNE